MRDRPSPPADRPPEAPSRPAFRVGITGHRLDKLSGDVIEVLRDRLRGLFDALDVADRRSGDRRSCILVSALAEGADRLAVDAAPPAWPLAALLPMPRAIYRQDFLQDNASTSASAEAFEAHLEQAETIDELPMLPPTRPGDEPSRTAQYAALGQALVGRIDCLVAIWDGKPPAGPGGTATVVAAAMERGVPVLWIDSSGNSPPYQVARLRDGGHAPIVAPLDDDALDRLFARSDAVT